MKSRTELVDANAAAAGLSFLTATPKPQRDVIDLKSPMTFAPRSNIIVTCSSTIKLELPEHYRVFITANTPTMLSSPTAMTLLPLGSLGADFLLGWNSLPKELKLHVLSFNLVDNEYIWLTIIREIRSQRFTLGPDLRRHLAMGPEIAQLAQEVFYQQNEFCIKARRAAFHLPHPTKRMHIRKIKLCVELDVRGWEVIQKMAAGGYGFDLIAEVHVAFYCAFMNAEFGELLHDVPLEPIVFTCRGTVVFAGAFADLSSEKFLQRTGHVKSDVERLVGERVVFAR